MPFARAHFVINTESGSSEDEAHALIREAVAARDGWALCTFGPDERSPGEAAREAVESGADLVVACGGDGTVSGVAQELLNSGVPIGIIPLGTANVFSRELGISGDPEVALALLTDGPHEVVESDAAKLGDECFVLRLSLGLNAAMVVEADSGLKKKIGSLAYLYNAWALRQRPRARYRLTLDGRERSVRGVTCIVSNSGNVGVPGIPFLPQIRIDDGQLDVIVLRHASLPGMAVLAGRVLLGALLRKPLSKASPLVHHWTAKRVTVSVEPEQAVSRDGEEVEEPGPYTIEVVPKALRFVGAPRPEPE